MAEPLALRLGATAQLLLPVPGRSPPNGEVRATSSSRRRTALATPGWGCACGTAAGAASGETSIGSALETTGTETAGATRTASRKVASSNALRQFLICEGVGHKPASRPAAEMDRDRILRTPRRQVVRPQVDQRRRHTPAAGSAPLRPARRSASQALTPSAYASICAAIQDRWLAGAPTSRRATGVRPAR